MYRLRNGDNKLLLHRTTDKSLLLWQEVCQHAMTQFKTFQKRAMNIHTCTTCKCCGHRLSQPTNLHSEEFQRIPTHSL